MGNRSNRFLRRLLSAATAAALAWPPSAHALRPTTPAETGLEEQLRVAMTAGVEETAGLLGEVSISYADIMKEDWQETLRGHLVRLNTAMAKWLVSTPLLSREGPFYVRLSRGGLQLVLYEGDETNGKEGILFSEAIKNSLDAFAGQVVQTKSPYVGELSVRLRRQGSEWTLELSDDGPGIPEEVLPNLFHQRWPGDHKSSELFLGNMGVAFLEGKMLGAELIRQHRGTIEVVTRTSGETSARRLVFDPDTKTTQILAEERRSTGTTLRWRFGAGAEESEQAAKAASAGLIDRFQRLIASQIVMGQGNRLVNQVGNDLPPWAGDIAWNGWAEYRRPDGSTLRYSLEKWFDRSSNVYLVRVGPYVYVDADKAALLSQAELTSVTQGAKLFKVKNLTQSVLADQPVLRSGRRIGPYTFSYLISLHHFPEWAGKIRFDSGAGSGEAWVPGVPTVLIEYDQALLDLARENLRANGLVEDKDFFLVKADISDHAAVRGAFRDLKKKLAALGWRPDGAVLTSNIGTFPGYYDVNNITSMGLVPLIEEEVGVKVSGIIGGGVIYPGAELRQGTVGEDIKAAEALGFSLAGEYGRFWASQVSRSTGAASMDTLSWIAVKALPPPAEVVPSPASARKADNFAWQMAPGSGVYLVPDALLEALKPSETGTAEGVSVRPSTEEWRSKNGPALLLSLSGSLPQLASLPEPEQQLLINRLLAPGNILFRRSVNRDRFIAILTHELAQRHAYRFEPELQAGTNALLESPWSELFLILDRTPQYHGGLTPTEFAGQWAELAGELLTNADRKEWKRLQADLRDAVRESRPGVPADLTAMVRQLDGLITRSVQSDLRRYRSEFLNGLKQSPVLTSLEVKPKTPPVTAQDIVDLQVKTRKRLSDNPDFIKGTIMLVMLMMSQRLSEAGTARISEADFVAWLTNKRVIDLGAGQDSELKAQLEKAGVTAVDTIERRDLGKSWAKTHSGYDAAFSMMSFNPTRVPEGMEEDQYWAHAARELRYILNDRHGLAFFLFGAGGNPVFHSHLADTPGLSVYPSVEEVEQGKGGGFYLVAKGRSVDEVLAEIAKEINAAQKAGVEEPLLLFPGIEPAIYPDAFVSWLEQGAARRWVTADTGNSKFGTVRAELRVGQAFSKVYTFPDPEWLEKFPGLKGGLMRQYGEGHYPPRMALEQIRVELLYTRDGRVAVFLDELQPGWGYRNTLNSREKRQLAAVRRAAADRIAEWAFSRGYMVFGASSESIVLEYAGMSREDRDHYDASYGPAWEPQMVRFPKWSEPVTVWAHVGNKLVQPPQPKWTRRMAELLGMGNWRMFRETPPIRPLSWRSDFQSGMEEVTASWGEVAATPPFDAVQKRLAPVFYDLGTFHVLPLVARSQVPFAVVVAPDEQEMVQSLLSAIRTPPAQYRMIVTPDKEAGILQAQRELEGNYRVHIVDKGRPNWLSELLAGLEEDGIIPIGEWVPALQKTAEFFAQFA